MKLVVPTATNSQVDAVDWNGKHNESFHSSSSFFVIQPKDDDDVMVVVDRVSSMDDSWKREERRGRG
jgi:hypothetical protein